jgi:hypothetical protein
VQAPGDAFLGMGRKKAGLKKAWLVKGLVPVAHSWSKDERKS